MSSVSAPIALTCCSAVARATAAVSDPRRSVTEDEEAAAAVAA